MKDTFEPSHYLSDLTFWQLVYSPIFRENRPLAIALTVRRAIFRASLFFLGSVSCLFRQPLPKVPEEEMVV